MTPTIHHGDCLEVMAGMPKNSVDAIVTDPPYGLGFMGRKWDALPPGQEWAEACLRVLKPGGHLLAFGGTRTWHRLAVAVEDAGFEIRDSIAWMYGSGFPKSLDISKAIDKRPGVQLHADFARHLTERREAAGLSRADVAEKVVGTRSGAVWNWERHQFPEARWWPALRDLLDMDEARWGPVIAEADRAKTGRVTSVTGRRSDPSSYAHDENVNEETAPATPEAEQWSGWGTALKPAFEPIIVARKPLTGTVAANTLKWGVGGINVDACRIGMSDEDRAVVDNRSGTTRNADDGIIYRPGINQRVGKFKSAPSGRWPANVVLDEHAAAELDQQSGQQRDGVAVNRNRDPNAPKHASIYGRYYNGTRDDVTYGSGGGASRFMYVAKAPKRERPNVDGVQHPTVKPLALMRWLVRLVTPPSGTVLDPFAGSGTTVEAALMEGFNPIGIEMTDEYLPLIQYRIERQNTA